MDDRPTTPTATSQIDLTSQTDAQSTNGAQSDDTNSTIHPDLASSVPETGQRGLENGGYNNMEVSNNSDKSPESPPNNDLSGLDATRDPEEVINNVNAEPCSHPSSTSEDVYVDLGGLDNPAYEPDLPSPPVSPENDLEPAQDAGEENSDSPINMRDGENDSEIPTSLTTPSSVSEDMAIDLSALESPTHEAKPLDGRNNSLSDKTMTPNSSLDEDMSFSVSITIDGEEGPPRYDEADRDNTPPSAHASTTVVTAIVESDKDGCGTGVPKCLTTTSTKTFSDRPEDSAGLQETVALNTSLLASGDTLPSLPPPHVLPQPAGDDSDAGILINDDMDKAALAELEMKILQKTESVSPPGAERCDSQVSTLSDKIDICRICHCEGEENNKLISPCLCSGSLKYLHLSCLQKWIKSSEKKSCELCNFDYIMSTKTRPFKEWEKLEMTHMERRKVVCSVTFHVIAITCVIWSLYVLIDRTTEEVHLGTLDWPFWTKLIVVAIGFTGGMIFMYVQCKMYVHLCVRWRAYNKLIFVENAPEDPQLRAEAAAKIKDKAQEEGGMVNPVALQELDAV